MAAIMPLLKLISKHGKGPGIPSMIREGKLLHTLMEETGMGVKSLKRLLAQSRAGKYASKYDWDNIFYHGTPDWAMSRTALNPADLLTNQRFGKLSKKDLLKAKEEQIEDLVQAGQASEILSPISDIWPSSHGNLGGGVYITNNPLFSFRMGQRKTSPPVGFQGARDATSRHWRTSNIPLLLKKDSKFIDFEDFSNKIEDLSNSYWSGDDAWEQVILDLAEKGFIGSKKLLPRRSVGGLKDQAEYALWDGSDIVRHPLAQFQREHGGLFAGLLPLISLLRGEDR